MFGPLSLHSVGSISRHISLWTGIYFILYSSCLTSKCNFQAFYIFNTLRKIKLFLLDLSRLRGILKRPGTSDSEGAGYTGLFCTGLCALTHLLSVSEPFFFYETAFAVIPISFYLMWMCFVSNRIWDDKNFEFLS